MVATVGSHRITEKELDAKIKPQLASVENQIYELKVGAIKSMADDYVLEQAAKKENISPEEYLKKHLQPKKITEADAKAFYGAHKDLAARYPKYDVIKDKLVQALQDQQDAQQKEALLDRLRKADPVTVMLTAPRVEVKFAGHPELGAASAPVTIVEFSDFQCPYCQRAEPVLKQVREKYGDKVRLVYMDFPLEIHDHSTDAASAGRCAEEQGKFWPLHDAMFADQSKLAPADLKADAKKLGLDTGKFDQCLDQGKIQIRDPHRRGARPRTRHRRHPGVLHQRTPDEWRAAVSEIRDHHRRGAGGVVVTEAGARELAAHHVTAVARSRGNRRAARAEQSP